MAPTAERKATRANSSRSLRVFFIRHAQSEENVRLELLAQTWQHARAFRIKNVIENIPSLTAATWKVINTLHASEPEERLSLLGERQLQEMSLLLKEKKFWRTPFTEATEEAVRDIVFCSPFYRARRTCEVLCPPYLLRYVEYLDCLAESSLLDDLLSTSSSEQRVRHFEHMLGTRVSNIPQEAFDEGFNVVVVGHCQFFRKVLKTDYYFRNGDVWSAQLVIAQDEARDGALRYEWSDVILEQRGFLSTPHPFRDSHPHESQDARIDVDGAHATVAGPGSQHTEGVANELEPTCRFCLMTFAENPTSPLIRPCLCTGTNAFIHVSCLQTWRRTSQHANNFCNVCLYRYRIKRSKWAESMCTARSVWIVTLLSLCLVLFSSGVCVHYLSQLEVSQKYLRFYCGEETLLAGILRLLDAPAICSPKLCAAMYDSLADDAGQVYRPAVVSRLRSWLTTIKRAYPLWPYFAQFCLLCNSVVRTCVAIIIGGFGFVSCVGLTMYFYSNVYTRIIVQGDQQERLYLLSMAFTVYNFGSRAVRFLTLIGSVFAFREVFNTIEIFTKMIAQRVESFQEPAGDIQ